MFLLGVRSSQTNNAQAELPSPNFQIDPRHSGDDHGWRFKVTYHDNGTTFTITRIDKNAGWHINLKFRVYDPATEAVPDFESTTYTYLGIDGERAPAETTLGIIHPSVKIVKTKAFWDCAKMKRCIMHDNVHTIEWGAFTLCKAMKVIRLSRTLRRIGWEAFQSCSSLDALFIPPSIEFIEDRAFQSCINIRIISISRNNEIPKLGQKIALNCGTLFEVTQIQHYARERIETDVGFVGGVTNSEEVNKSILNFYHSLPPLHKACLDTNVTAQSINNCIITHGREAASNTDHDGMTPLHILAINPHASPGSIVACLHAGMESLFVGDNRHQTPLDYLRQYNLEGHTAALTAVYMHRYASCEVKSNHWNNYKRKRIKND